MVKSVAPAVAVVPSVPGRYEGMIVFTLCLVAALRVFLFSAGFPFFNNVDEPSHFDLVRKYARGHIPSGVEHFDTSATRDILLYGSPEYLMSAERFPGGTFPPPVWTLSFDRIRDEFETRMEKMARGFNHESTQPPLYYAIAGLWYGIGEGFGLHGGAALYWIRFMNMIVCALLVWLAYIFGRTLLPSSSFIRLGMPFLVAFFPQDVLYSVNNDVLLPLAGGAALWALFVLMQGKPEGYVFHMLTGLLVTASVLVKLSSVPVVLMAMVTVVVIVHRAGVDERRAAISRCSILLLAVVLPLAVWGFRNVVVLGDLTGSGAKVKLLGWSLKPVGALFNHPLFTAGGLATFWHETMTTFWRGEFTWGLKRISSGGWDLFYSVSSIVLPATAIAALVIRRRTVAHEVRVVLWLSLATFLLSLLFLAVMTVIFDFGNCFYPSLTHPFLTSGRLVLAALLPFVGLYLTGLEVLLPGGGRMAMLRWVLLMMVVAWMTISEVGISHCALHSEYNWFHMVSSEGR